MNKRLKSCFAFMVAVLLIASMSPAMASVPEKLPQPDGILVDDVIQNQFTVQFVGELPDPNDDTDQVMDGTSGMITHNIRQAILKDNAGHEETIKLGKEVKNFDQIKKGDIVTIRVERRVAFFVGKEELVPGSGDKTTKYSAPKGSKPGYVEVKESFVTLAIMKLDAAKKEVTVKLPDKTIKTVVAPKLDFSLVKVGQNVIVQVVSEQNIAVTAP